MHNIKDLRKNLNIYKKKLSDRNFDLKTELFKDLDDRNRKLVSEKEKLEQEKGILSKSKDQSNFEKSKKSLKKSQNYQKSKFFLKKSLMIYYLFCQI